MEDAPSHNSWQQLLNEESQQNTGDGSEVEVVNQENGLELERLAVAHELAATQNDEIVKEDENASLLKSGHGRLPGDEAEVGDGVAGESYDSEAPQLSLLRSNKW